MSVAAPVVSNPLWSMTTPNQFTPYVARHKVRRQVRRRLSGCLAARPTNNVSSTPTLAVLPSISKLGSAYWNELVRGRLQKGYGMITF